MRAELRPFYGHRWRTVTRPWILLRSGGRCEKCGVRAKLLDVAHLVVPVGQPGHDDYTNLAALCRTDHRALDYPQWAAAFRVWLEAERERRIARKDAARPLLVVIEERAGRPVPSTARCSRQ